MGALVEFIPFILQLLSLGLKWAGAKQDTLAAFQRLVEASHDEGLITVKSKDVFLKQKEQMERELEQAKPV